MKSIAIYGASGHGKVVAEIAKLHGYNNIIYIDDGANEHIPFEDFLQKSLNIPVAFGIGDNQIRAKMYQKCIKNKLIIKTLIHPSASISEYVQIAEGTVVMANVVINVDSIIGKCCIINSSSIVEHDNTIGDFVHLSPHVACAGNIKIQNYTHIGIGTCIIQGITIGSNSIIGAGSVVIKDIKSKILAYGNPCKAIKEIR